MKARLTITVLIYLLSAIIEPPRIYGAAGDAPCNNIPRKVSQGLGRCPSNQCSASQQCINCYDAAFGPPSNDSFVCTDLPPRAIVPPVISTEIGTLNPEPQELIQALVRIFVGLSGGLSLFLLLYGAGRYVLSQGNPENVEEAKQVITHAVGGVLLVFLSVFLLRFIGIDLLHIPGFTPAGGGGVNVPSP